MAYLKENDNVIERLLHTSHPAERARREERLRALVDSFSTPGNDQCGVTLNDAMMRELGELGVLEKVRLANI
jgi:hypothetical protein